MYFTNFIISMIINKDFNYWLLQKHYQLKVPCKKYHLTDFFFFKKVASFLLFYFVYGLNACEKI